MESKKVREWIKMLEVVKERVCSVVLLGEEIADEIPGGDDGHSQEDEGSLADAESTSVTLP